MRLPGENAVVGAESRRTSIEDNTSRPCPKGSSSNCTNTPPAMHRILCPQLLVAMPVLPLPRGNVRQTMAPKATPKLHPHLEPTREGMLLL